MKENKEKEKKIRKKINFSACLLEKTKKAKEKEMKIN